MSFVVSGIRALKQKPESHFHDMMAMSLYFLASQISIVHLYSNLSDAKGHRPLGLFPLQWKLWQSRGNLNLIGLPELVTGQLSVSDFLYTSVKLI